MNTNIDKSVSVNNCSVIRGLDICTPRNEHLIDPSQQEIGELLQELLIRFDSEPKYYQKEDFRVLIEALRKILCATTGQATLVINDNLYTLTQNLNEVYLTRYKNDGTKENAGTVYLPVPQDTVIEKVDFDEQGRLYIYTSDGQQFEIPYNQEGTKYSLNGDGNTVHLVGTDGSDVAVTIPLSDYTLEQSEFGDIQLKRDGNVINEISLSSIDVGYDEGSRKLRIRKNGVQKDYILSNDNTTYKLEQLSPNTYALVDSDGDAHGTISIKSGELYTLSDTPDETGITIKLSPEGSSQETEAKIPIMSRNNVGLAKVFGKTAEESISTEDVDGVYYGVELDSNNRLVVKIPQKKAPKTYTLTVEVVDEAGFSYYTDLNTQKRYGDQINEVVQEGESKTINLSELNIDPHFTFLKWKKDLSESPEEVFELNNISQNILLQAVVVPKTYTVKLSGNNTNISFDGENISGEEQELQGKYLQEIPLYAFPLDGYSFAGFFDSGASVNTHEYISELQCYKSTYVIRENKSIVAIANANGVEVTTDVYASIEGLSYAPAKGDPNQVGYVVTTGSPIVGETMTFSWSGDGHDQKKYKFDKFIVTIDGVEQEYTDNFVQLDIQSNSPISVIAYIIKRRYSISIDFIYTPDVGEKQTGEIFSPYYYGDTRTIDPTKYLEQNARLYEFDRWEVSNIDGGSWKVEDGNLIIKNIQSNISTKCYFKLKELNTEIQIITDDAVSSSGGSVQVISNDVVLNKTTDNKYKLKFKQEATVVPQPAQGYHLVAFYNGQASTALNYRKLDWKSNTDFTIESDLNILGKEDQIITVIFSKYSDQISYEVNSKQMGITIEEKPYLMGNIGGTFTPGEVPKNSEVSLLPYFSQGPKLTILSYEDLNLTSGGTYYGYIEDGVEKLVVFSGLTSNPFPNLTKVSIYDQGAKVYLDNSLVSPSRVRWFEKQYFDVDGQISDPEHYVISSGENIIQCKQDIYFNNNLGPKTGDFQLIIGKKIYPSGLEQEVVLYPADAWGNLNVGISTQFPISIVAKASLSGATAQVRITGTEYSLVSANGWFTDADGKKWTMADDWGEILKSESRIMETWNPRTLTDDDYVQIGDSSTVEFIVLHTSGSSNYQLLYPKEYTLVKYRSYNTQNKAWGDPINPDQSNIKAFKDNMVFTIPTGTSSSPMLPIWYQLKK